VGGGGEGDRRCGGRKEEEMLKGGERGVVTVREGGCGRGVKTQIERGGKVRKGG